MGGKLTEAEFVNAICGGCNKAGTLGAVADGIGDRLTFMKRLSSDTERKRLQSHRRLETETAEGHY